jgi:CubicO group peptidase (beta-lactamase class C family)
MIFSVTVHSEVGYNCCHTGWPAAWLTSSTLTVDRVERSGRTRRVFAARAVASSPSGWKAFCRKGALDGVRLLSPRAARLMHTNQSGALHSNTGLGFGYGFEVVDRYGAKDLAGVGAFGWGGAYGTTYQVDPESRLVVVFMMQLIPNRTDVQQKFMDVVYQALE